jgi:hypothetical protein
MRLTSLSLTEATQQLHCLLVGATLAQARGSISTVA